MREVATSFSYSMARMSQSPASSAYNMAVRSMVVWGSNSIGLRSCLEASYEQPVLTPKTSNNQSRTVNGSPNKGPLYSTGRGVLPP